MPGFIFIGQRRICGVFDRDFICTRCFVDLSLLGQIAADRRSRLGMVWSTARLLLWVLTCLGILIVALWSLREQIDRGEGLSGDAIFKGSFYFKHLISLILPYSTVKGGYDFWQGDQSMINIYVGLPALMLLILSTKRLDQSFFDFGG